MNDNVNYTIGSRALVTNFLDLTNSVWFPIESSTLPTCKSTINRDDTGNKENDADNNLKDTANQESSLENMTLTRIMADVEYNKILELVICDDIPHTLHNNYYTLLYRSTSISVHV